MLGPNQLAPDGPQDMVSDDDQHPPLAKGVGEEHTGTVNFTISGRTVKNGKFHESSTPVCRHPRLVHIYLYVI